MLKNIKTVKSVIKSGCILILAFTFSHAFSQDLKSAIKLSASEQFEAADQIFQSLIQKEPNNGDNYYYFAENILKSYFTDTAFSDYKDLSAKAMAQYKKGTEMDIANSLNFIGIGKLSLFNNDLPNAKISFAKALSLLPKKPQRNGPIKADRYALVLMKVADAYVQANYKDTNETLPLLRRALQYDPSNPDIYITMGDAYLMQLNNGSLAIDNYKTARDLDSKSSKSVLRIGRLYQNAKAYNEALTYYREAIKIDSTFAPAYRELAELCALAGYYGDAVRTYNTFLSISPNNITAKARYAQFLFKAKEYQHAIDQINDVFKEDSTKYNILNRIAAYSYFELNQQDKALKSIEKFYANANPDKIIIKDWIYYGRILSKSKLDSLAIDKYQKALAIDTSNNDVLSYMIGSYAGMKKYNEAAFCYQKKINNGSTNVNDVFNMGKYYYYAANWKMADTSFAKFIVIQPDNPQGYLFRARVNVNFDPETKEGTAKPYYEIFIDKAKTDSVKYKNELFESYQYLGFYYFKQFINAKKKPVDKDSSVSYCFKALAINPYDEKSKEILKYFKIPWKPKQ